MNDKKYRITYQDKFWHNEKGEREEKIFMLCVWAISSEQARAIAEELTCPATILSIEEQD